MTRNQSIPTRGRSAGFLQQTQLCSLFLEPFLGLTRVGIIMSIVRWHFFYLQSLDFEVLKSPILSLNLNGLPRFWLDRTTAICRVLAIRLSLSVDMHKYLEASRKLSSWSCLDCH